MTKTYMQATEFFSPKICDEVRINHEHKYSTSEHIELNLPIAMFSESLDASVRKQDNLFSIIT